MTVARLAKNDAILATLTAVTRLHLYNYNPNTNPNLNISNNSKHQTIVISIVVQ